MDVLSKFRKLKHEFEACLEKKSKDESFFEELYQFEKMLTEKEKTIEDELENYKKLFENAEDYIFVLSAGGRILTVNKAACAKYQIPFEEFIHTSIMDVDASHNIDEIMQNVDNLLRTGSARFEATHRRRDGETFVVDVIAQKINWKNEPAFLHICRDISSQKQLQQALNESETKLKQIINQIKDGIIIYDKNGKIVIWNTGVENITGINRKDAIGQKLYELQYDILHGKYKDKALIKKMFDEVVNKSNPHVFNKIFENDIYIEGEGVKTLQAIVFPIELEAETQLFGSVIRDITEGKQIENQLRELNAAKDKIFSVIAHDLRTPFNSIIGFTDLLLENYDGYDDVKKKKILQYINLSAKPTLDVLTNLLDWVNVQTGQHGYKVEVCSLKPLVQDVLKIMAPTATMKDISLDEEIPEHYEVYADLGMLKSVFQNLITNAIKFSHTGGKVEVSASVKQNFIEIMVADEGIGIDEEKKEVLFNIDSHESTLGTLGEKGSGLGLILCKEFIRRLGGEIKVKSRKGMGSRFIFTVPAAGVGSSLESDSVARHDNGR